MMFHAYQPSGCLPQDYLMEKSKRYVHPEDAAACLQEEFKVTWKQHPKFPNLFQFKYDQIESDMSLPIVQQCRGIILNADARWRVVARPFDKFFNHGEGHAAQIDWRSARAYEKLDGSLMIMYYYNDQWQIATSGTPDAGGEVNGLGVTFQKLFWQTWEAKKFTYPPMYQRCYTFLFELTSPFNKVVVKQPKSDLRLIGIRSIYSGMEMDIRAYQEYDPVQGVLIRQPSELLASFEDMDPLEQEGWVVRDDDYRRIKMKHPGYVALHHLRDSFSPRNILQVVRTGEIGEMVACFPEWKMPVDRIKAAYDGLAMVLEQDWENIKDIEPRKDFAEAAKKTPSAGVMFALKDKKAESVQKALQGMHIDRLMALIGIRGSEVTAELVEAGA